MDNSKLSFADQIEWLKNHGVGVEDEPEAQKYLKYKSYFYKMISFVKVFNSTENGEQCINNFNMLVDISTLDMELRYCLLKVCLDIEHAIKTYLLRIITNDPDEDGYHIVQEVINRDENPEGFKRKLFSSVSHYDNNGHFIVNEEYQQFYDNPPIWIIIEISSLGKLRSFVEYLSRKRPNNKTLQQLRESFKYINRLRNSCAHNRVLFNKDALVNEEEPVPHNIYSVLRNDDLTSSEIHTPLLLQISLALRIHKTMCSQKSHQHKIDDLKEWCTRMQRNSDLYQGKIFSDLFNSICNSITIYSD
ncbi:Abi family protein [Limosilactobacillus albertensis]|uniref:Abi family protein n=1 Tax=Limosilactobacillus albertensis TaxID=2759752 RepID=A0A839HB70_9LACO|nr:Abi family protein [Limosilactobacillus albertensis]MBB1124568.1 Abi family protein [Limosilactobacillus albertensis]MCD7123195.1 Abi family protein [Limosilactobacillus albertensis]